MVLTYLLLDSQLAFGIVMLCYDVMVIVIVIDIVMEPFLYNLLRDVLYSDFEIMYFYYLVFIILLVYNFVSLSVCY